ncbi:MAG: hypothetical protein JNK46_13290 [Methylobacteriaceae bacterium]|nr:hypothetical protein [Methylobacteriaceae bacterium]
MLVLGIYHSHDACAALYDDYRLIAAIAQERPTRVKGDGGRFPAEAAAECLAQAGVGPDKVDVVALPRVDYPRAFYKKRAFRPFPSPRKGDDLELIRVMTRQLIGDPAAALDAPAWLAQFGLGHAKPFFYNHHAAHALGTLFHTDWDEALLYTSDGGGDRVYYSLRRLKDGRLEDVFGGEADSRKLRRPQGKQDSLGNMYLHVTQALGFRPLRHEGKVLGLAAFGAPRFADRLKRFYRVEADGQIRGLAPLKEIAAEIGAIAREGSREDVAASAQQTLEDLTLESMARIVARHPAKNLGVSGGVFANVKLTQRVAERFPFEEVFVYPAMSDQGEAAGGALQFLYERDGLATWLTKRQRFGDLYYGRDYMAGADAVFRAAGMRAVASDNVAAAAAALVAEGKIVGTYLGRGEYGPRALGARSIMAAPTERAINDWLNKRLDRTEFMPFAPVVRAERAQEVFRLPDSLMYTARFMTVTCDVAPEWRERIPAVVHVDGTARPQVLRRQDNPTYYDVIAAYEAKSGIPLTINTSFNVHEEPIINRPEEALKALQQGRVDFVLTEGAVWAP